jgi:maltooligosyltrehalose trehalohydrolase
LTPEGTFDGAIQHLEHLEALGVTHVELMPVASFPGARGWGYDGVALYAPHRAYGGPAALKRLVDACHRRGLGVIMDLVYNHLGPSGNYLAEFGPYFTERYRTPWGQAVNLDGAHSDEVRRFFIDNATGWIRDYHIDGLRLDAVHALTDVSAVHFLEKLATEVHALADERGRPVAVIGESDLNDPRLVAPPGDGAHGLGLDAMWADDFHHALHAVLTGERSGYYEDFGTIEQLAKALTTGLVYDGIHSRHRKRSHGRPLGGVSGRRLIAFAQNHDQIGNRARGERLVHLTDLDAAKVAAAIVLLGPCVPLLFQGEEWASSSPFPYFTDHDDPALARAVSEGRRREFAPFGWSPDEIPDPQSPATFASALLDWSERERSPHAEMLSWYQALIRLRRSSPALLEGRFAQGRVRFDEAAGWIVLEREPILLAAQLRPAPARIPLIDETWRVALACGPAPERDGAALRLPGRGCVVLAKA